MTKKQRWMWRAVGVTALVVAVGGTWAGFNASVLRARFAAQELATASTDDERARCADKLAALGTPGFERLIGFVKTGDEPSRAAAVGALDRHLTTLPDGDPRAVTICGSVLDAFPNATDPGKRGVLQLVPVILKRTGGTHAERCRGVVAEGLKMPDLDARLLAVRLALHPDIKLRAELIPLLAAKEPEVRGAGLFAAATAEGEQVLNDEELFRWLHDTDAGVRKVCHDVLLSRDRSGAEISLGRRLTHTDPNERLKLLLDLKYDDDVSDPEPWLERLSRDPEPAVRAGAARVMVEVAMARERPYPAWVARVADGDLHPTVRFVAGYYRSRPAPGGVIPAGGP